MMEEEVVNPNKFPRKISKKSQKINRILIFNGFKRIKMHLKSRKLKIHFSLKI